MDQPTALLRLSGITKRFPGCLANDHVDLVVEAGSIHALLGENGAGKSTLVKMMSGLLRPDEGTLAWAGRPVTIPTPAAARALGIALVFQHFSLFESMSVTENIALGLDRPAERVDLPARIRTLSARYGLPLDPTRLVHDLSVGERQRIEIVRCLLQQPKLLIMDEPTSVLTPQEVTALFVTLRRLAAEGCAILYISHKLEEIRALCDHATILRQGRVVGHCDPRQTSAAELAELMVGEGVPALRAGPAVSRSATPRLELDRLSLPAERPFGVRLDQVSLAVAGGEIVGIAGVAGNGQTELMEALIGEARVAPAAAIRIDGVAVGRAGPAARRRRGAAFLPEDRNGHGAVGALSLLDNAILTAAVRQGLVAGGLIRLARARAYVERIIHRFGVRTTGPAALARSLSGGNLQKFLIGREVMLAPGVLVISQPTWGVDAGAVATIHQALKDLAATGSAVVIISQDLDEILALADRVAVIAGGRLTPARPLAEFGVDAIGLAMGGGAGGQGEAGLDHAA